MSHGKVRPEKSCCWQSEKKAAQTWPKETEEGSEKECAKSGVDDFRFQDLDAAVEGRTVAAKPQG